MSASLFPLTARLGELVSTVRERKPSETAVQRARVAFIDTVGVMIAGMGEPPVGHLRRTLAAIGRREEDDRPSRLLVYGTAAHALDFDDVAFGGHISAVLVPAILAAAQGADHGGEDLLYAYVAGFECWAELAAREKTLYHARGLHPTGILGTVAAAGACSALWRQDGKTASTALAIAASQSAGLTANFGSMTKPFHVGRAVEAGYLAAQLAANGFSASADALEAENGFLRSFSPAGEVDRERGLHFDLEGGWFLEKRSPSIKRYPVCYAAHRSIDAALQLSDRVRERPADIRKVTISVSRRHSDILRYSRPRTVAQARFSLEFAVSAALLHGWVGFFQLREDVLNDPATRRLIESCERVMEPRLDSQLDGFAVADRVTVAFSDASVLASAPVRRARGHESDPLAIADIRRKFSDCLAGRRTEAEALFGMLSDLTPETEPAHVARLVALLHTLCRPGSPSA